MNNNQAIGIFDSGIGGLTVANAINNILPNEKIIYFGDTAHLPYGEKSEDAIKYYSIRIAQFLLKQNCKVIVIACNTASAAAFNVVKDFVETKIPVINVIDPIVENVVKKGSDKIGIIGTKRTIQSDIYAKKINALNKNINVASLATPLLASMIEEGFFNNNISRTIINAYLSKRKLVGIKSLILACTHYPLIKPEIAEYYKDKVEIIDSAQIVAKYVKSLLTEKKLLNQSGKKPKHHFYVSDYTESFEKSTAYFFKNKIHLEEANFWN